MRLFSVPVYRSSRLQPSHNILVSCLALSLKNRKLISYFLIISLFFFHFKPGEGVYFISFYVSLNVIRFSYFPSLNLFP